jgi:hypothetical protein
MKNVDFNKYLNDGSIKLKGRVYTYPETSIYKKVPIQFLEEMRFHLKNQKIKYRIRWRGPRNSEIMDTRNKYLKQSSCLKDFATHFSVYYR